MENMSKELLHENRRQSKIIDEKKKKFLSINNFDFN